MYQPVLISVAIARGRLFPQCDARTFSWEEFAEEITTVLRTSETAEEYAAMSRELRGKVKDTGGFVAALLSDGRRCKASVVARTAVTLDLDYVPAGKEDDVAAALEAKGWLYAIYSTHSYTLSEPRLRVVIPVSRDMTVEEYAPVARAAAAVCGIEYADTTTYDPSRLFYFPSASKDAPIYTAKDTVMGRPLDVDAVLASFKDWRNPEEWPRGEREALTDVAHAAAPVRRLDDPRRKDNIVGRFCAAFNVYDVINTFLSDKYRPVPHIRNRFSYTLGSSAGGLCVFNDGQSAFSFHDTDPAGRSRHAVNAFDLLRIHLFGDLDTDTPADTPMHLRPSFRALTDFIATDPRCAAIPARGGLEAPHSTGRQAKPKKKEARNFALEIADILSTEPDFAGLFRYNAFTCQKELARNNTPWARVGQTLSFDDTDFAGLSMAVAKRWNIYKPQILRDTLTQLAAANKYNPVTDYLSSLQWDGTPRLERVMIDFFGADDTPLMRAMTRLWHVAAVARAFVPGTKFDHILVLQGEQGCGKSTYLRTMAGPWFNDSLPDIGKESKDAMQALSIAWIIEMAELMAVKRADEATVKAFVSRQEDRFRPSYGREQVTILRHVIFAATTNEDTFLNGQNGNRRWWIVRVNPDRAHLSVWTDLPTLRDQLWAEAVALYKASPDAPLCLPPHLEQAARTLQSSVNTVNDDPLFDAVARFIARPIPIDAWPKMSADDRRRFFATDGAAMTLDRRGHRDRICQAEIINEMPDLAQRTDRKTGARISQILTQLASDGLLGENINQWFGAYRSRKGREILPAFFSQYGDDIENSEVPF